MLTVYAAYSWNIQPFYSLDNLKPRNLRKDFFIKKTIISVSDFSGIKVIWMHQYRQHWAGLKIHPYKHTIISLIVARIRPIEHVYRDEKDLYNHYPGGPPVLHSFSWRSPDLSGVLAWPPYPILGTPMTSTSYPGGTHYLHFLSCWHPWPPHPILGTPMTSTSYPGDTHDLHILSWGHPWPPHHILVIPMTSTFYPGDTHDLHILSW